MRGIAEGERIRVVRSEERNDIATEWLRQTLWDKDPGDTASGCFELEGVNNKPSGGLSKNGDRQKRILNL